MLYKIDFFENNFEIALSQVSNQTEQLFQSCPQIVVGIILMLFYRIHGDIQFFGYFFMAFPFQTFHVDFPACRRQFLEHFIHQSIYFRFYNLVDNAIKFTPEGRQITVQVTEKSDKVYVSVKDEGVGIPPESIKKVFDRFYRCENSTHTVKGTGLGLHLVKTTIEKYHNGKVFVNSALGQGATFGVVLPVKIETEMEKVC